MLIGSIGTENVKVYWSEGNSYYIEYTVSSGAYSGYKRGYIPKSSLSSSAAISWSTYSEMWWTYPFSTSSTFRYISYGFKSAHKGIDIISSDNSNPINGQQIKCPANGKVIYSEWDNTAGNTIIIETNSVDPYNNHKLRVGIQHMQDESSYADGATVSPGTILGKVGTTGSSSTGPHLHIYVRSDNNLWTNVAGRAINPQAFFNRFVSFTGDDTGILSIN